jgi:hypothetical protein
MGTIMMLRTFMLLVIQGLLIISMQGCNETSTEGGASASCISPNEYEQPTLYLITEAGGQTFSISISSNEDGSYTTLHNQEGNQQTGSITFVEGIECLNSVDPLTTEESLLVYGNMNFDVIAESYFNVSVTQRDSNADWECDTQEYEGSERTERQCAASLNYSNGENLDVNIIRDLTGGLLSLTIMHENMLVYSIELT